MKSVRFLGNVPVSLPIVADDILELHATRLILLIHYCGTKGTINGLTKLAKLDFFVRYPAFFNRVSRKLGGDESSNIEQFDSSMVRYHYGPWDKRYYQLLAFLEARGLIKVEKKGRTFIFIISDLGKTKAESLSRQSSFDELVLHMKAVKKVMGRKSGSTLKEIVYEVFDKEVAQRKLGEIIR